MLTHFHGFNLSVAHQSSLGGLGQGGATDVLHSNLDEIELRWRATLTLSSLNEGLRVDLAVLRPATGDPRRKLGEKPEKQLENERSDAELNHAFFMRNKRAISASTSGSLELSTSRKALNTKLCHVHYK